MRSPAAENKLTASATTLADYTYGEDAAGNITSIHDAVSSTYNRDFGYDDLNRLTSANTGAALWGTGSYGYDHMGNMTALSLGTAHTASFSYSGTTPKLSSVTENGTSRSVSYDSAGNETSVGSTTTTISPRNLMKESEQSSWVYDGRGVRTSSTPPPFLLTFAPANVNGRDTTTGTVTLASAAPGGGAMVTLTSSNTAALTVPSTVTISAGNTSATFTATTYDVDTTQIVTLTAAYDSASVDAEVGVQTPAWYLTSLEFLPVNVGPDTPDTTGTVTLASVAPVGGARVYLYVYEPHHGAGYGPGTLTPPSEAGFSIPDYVDVAAGYDTATFIATGESHGPLCSGDDCASLFQITGVLGASQEGDFYYHSNQDYADSEGYRGSATLLAITTLPGRFEQGESGRGTITLNAPAPRGGVIVSLSASRPGVQLPPTVLVQEGAVTASFELATEAEALPGDLTITASQDEISRSRAITILPKDGHQPRKQSWWNRLNLHQPEAIPLSLGIRGAFFDLRPRTNTITPSHKYYLYTPELIHA